MRKTVFLILFLVFLVVFVSFYYYRRNIFSKEVLKLEILGPEKAKMGEEIEYLVKYKNQGNTTLEEAKLIFQYPEGAFPVKEEGEEKEEMVKDLEDIYPGEEDSLSFKARLFGKEGMAKKAKATLSFRPKNLTAFFESETTFITEITVVPLTFEIDLPSKVEVGKDFSFRINYFSSADYPLSGLGVRIDYPSGFEFLSSIPTSFERTEFNIGLLNATEGGRIEIEGRIEGKVREEKFFRAALGLWKEGEFISLKETTKAVQIVKPCLYVSFLVNGSPEAVANPGDFLHFEIFFRNIGGEPFEDLFLITNLKGESIDFDTIRIEEGNFQKEEKFIFWDWKEVPLLKFLGPGEEGRVEFWLQLKREWDISEEKENPEIIVEVNLAKMKEAFVIKVNSLLEIEQQVFFNEERFSNKGPLPPQVGETTTYTVVWKTKNYYNDIENAKVKAVLPEQVRLTGRIEPEDSKLTFDSESREIVWDIGEIKAGSGVLEPEKLVAFQIKLRPTEEQRGMTAILINEAKIEGEDLWTGKTIEATAPAVDTTLPDDPTVTEPMGIIQ